MRVRSFHIADLAALDSAPFDRELELDVIDGERAHALAFPCRRVIGGWIDAETNKRVYYIHPTHWREWSVVYKALGFSLGENNRALIRGGKCN